MAIVQLMYKRMLDNTENQSKNENRIAQVSETQ